MAPITIHGPKEGFMLYLVPLGKEAAFCGCSNTWLAVDQQLRMAEVIVIIGTKGPGKEGEVYRS